MYMYPIVEYAILAVVVVLLIRDLYRATGVHYTTAFAIGCYFVIGALPFVGLSDDLIWALLAFVFARQWYVREKREGVSLEQVPA